MFYLYVYLAIALFSPPIIQLIFTANGEGFTLQEYLVVSLASLFWPIYFFITFFKFLNSIGE